MSEISDFLVKVEGELEAIGSAVVADAKVAVTTVENVVVSDVDPAVSAFMAQFNTDLGKSALKLSVQFVNQAKTDIVGAAKALVAAIPAELISDAEDALNVALNTLRVKLEAPAAP